MILTYYKYSFRVDAVKDTSDTKRVLNLFSFCVSPVSLAIPIFHYRCIACTPILKLKKLKKFNIVRCFMVHCL